MSLQLHHMVSIVSGMCFISILVLSWLLFDDDATCKYIGNSLWPDLTATGKDSIFVQAFVNSLKPGLKKAMLNNKPRILERARIEAATLEDVDHRMVAEKSQDTCNLVTSNPMASLKNEVATIKSLMERQAQEQSNKR